MFPSAILLDDLYANLSSYGSPVNSIKFQISLVRD
jgi:hypothetical protein